MTGMGHTGGMIALVPVESRALAITDGEPADELHLTLAYLGDDVVDGWLPEQRDAVLRLGRALSEVHDPIDARVFAHAKFNPDGGPDGDREPCLVYLVGDTSALGEMRSWTLSRLREEIGEALLPQQHEPFIPHITAAYGRELPYGLFTTGPVVFDRIRVALGDDVTDYPLGGGAEMQPPVDDTDAWFEQKVMSPDPRAGRLREYWAHGPGRRKWNKWRQLRRHLAKYVKNPNILDGLTSNIYRLAKGHNPPRGKSAEDFLSEAEIKAALVLSDPDAPFLLDEDDDEDDGAGSEDDADHLFEQALVDDVDWRIDADGSLVRDDDESAGDWDDPDDEDESVGPRTPSSMGPSLFDLFPGD